MQVTVFNVNNLTDARYFSAMMTDYIHIPITNNDVSFDNFMEIVHWVEGPQFLCSFSDSLLLHKRLQIEEIKNYYGEVKILENGFKVLPNNNDAPYEFSFWEQGAIDHIIITEIPQLKSVTTTKNNQIALIASGENEVGVKDFEFFDHFFEKIRI